MSFNPAEKPDPAVCPGKLCFLWRLGRMVRSGDEEPATVREGCGNPFGVCIRLDAERGDSDWYSNHGPNLEKAGLPWFYFYPSPDGLTANSRQKYIEESEALWGKEHWKRETGGL